MGFLGATLPFYSIKSTPGLPLTAVLVLLAGMAVLMFLALRVAFLTPTAKEERINVPGLVYSVSGLLAFLLFEQILDGYYESYLTSMVTVTTGALIALAVEGSRKQAT